MPNNTLNILTRCDGGSLTPIEKYMGPDNSSQFNEEMLDFCMIIPLPKDAPRNSSQWRIANWGTKWNSYHVCRNGEGEDWTELRFCTAWEPPIPVIRELAIQTGLDFRLDYADEGGFWIGVCIANQDGTIDQRTFHSDKDGAVKDAPMDLQESFRHGEYSDKFKWTPVKKNSDATNRIKKLLKETKEIND
jgi:hypothetical protein